MRDPKLRRLAGLRRVLAVTGRVSVAAGVVLLVAGWHQAVPRVAHSPYAKAAPTVVTGPHMYIPGTKDSLYQNASQVTVSQTTNLVNQLVQVSWSNFTPSNTKGQPFYVYNGGGATDYAVLVAECQGLTPAWNTCYEANQGGVPQAAGPDGTPNAEYGITGTGTARAGGSGSVNVDIETSLENAVLGCDQSHPCSLVIVPAEGGAPTNCKDHSGDLGFGPIPGTAAPTNAFSATTGGCSWADRIVVPLHFAAVPTGCSQRTAAFSAAGSPMMASAMQQWLTGLCSGSNGMTIAYNSTIAEPQAVQELASGATDVALTTVPAGLDGVPVGTQKFLYAPVAISAVAIAYWVDDNITGQQLSGLQLNPRILAKLLTTSYNPGIACAPGVKPCDKGINPKNPFDVLADPEFQALNPNITKNTNWQTDQTYIVPTVQSGASDMTWTLTRYVGGDSAATAFLTGSGAGGTVVNSYFKGLKLPENTFTTQDPNPPWTDEYSPVFPLSAAVADQAVSQDAGSFTPVVNPNGSISYTRDPPQPVGKRMLFAVVDEGDAALDQFPVAAIPNAAGKYVTPSSTSMAAAVAHMVSDGTGTTTVQTSLTDKTPAAYPLTMVVYAMVPASGMAHTTATAVAKFLDFAAGAGQTPGVSPGQLAAGYLPLTSSMKSATLKIASTVAKETSSGTPSGNQTTPPPGGSTPTVPGAGLGGTATPTPNPSLSLPAVNPSANPSAGAQAVSLSSVHVLPAALTRYALPALLILGGLSALAGTSALAGAGEGGVLGLLRRFGKASETWAQSARNFTGRVRTSRSRLSMDRLTRRGKDS